MRFLESARYRVGTSRTHLAKITADDRHDVGEVFRHVHTLRGEARCFDLDAIEARLARIEFELADLRTRRDERYDLAAAKASIEGFSCASTVAGCWLSAIVARMVMVGSRPRRQTMGWSSP